MFGTKNSLVALTLLLCFSSALPMVADQHTMNTFGQQQAMNEQYDFIHTYVVEAIKKLNVALQDLALIVHNNQVRNLDKMQVLPKLMQLRQFVDALEQSKVVTVSQDHICALLDVTNCLITYVSQAVRTKFNDFPAFNPETMIKRRVRDELRIEELVEEVTEMHERIDALEYDCENVGLTLFNNAFRKLEQFNKKYKVVRYSTIAGVFGLAGLYLLYMTPRETIENWTGKKLTDSECKNPKEIGELPHLLALKGLIGEPMAVDNTTKEIIYKPGTFYYGYLTWLHETFGAGRMNLADFQLPTLIGLVMFKEKFEEGGKRLWDWTGRKISVAASYLRGGPIKKTMSEFEKEPKATFDDVIGSEEAKIELAPLIQYVLNHEKFDKSGIVPPTGVLLIGAPRTGKSFIAEAVAGEIKRASAEKVRMLELTAAELKAMGITKVFDIAQEIAKETGPIILLIDEIDTGNFVRNGQNADNPALCELLAALSSVNRQKSKKIVVIGCTNKPENIDPALLEPGRLGIHIYFHYPTEEQRREFLVRELTNRTITVEDGYLDELAHKTQGCSFDALSLVLTSALQQAKMHGTTVTARDLEHAFDQEINRIVFNELTIPDHEQQLVAIHQAGQTIARIALETRRKILKATTYAVSPDITQDNKWEEEQVNARSLKNRQKQYGYVFTLDERNSAQFLTEADHIDEIKVLLAGHAAERLVNKTTGYVYNKHNSDAALELAKYVVFKGMGDKQLPKELREAKAQEAYQLMEQCKKEVEAVLAEHTQELLAVANALHEERLLTAEQIHQAIAEAKNAHCQDTQEEDVDLDALLEGTKAPAMQQSAPLPTQNLSAATAESAAAA